MGFCSDDEDFARLNLPGAEAATISTSYNDSYSLASAVALSPLSSNDSSETQIYKPSQLAELPALLVDHLEPSISSAAEANNIAQFSYYSDRDIANASNSDNNNIVAEIDSATDFSDPLNPILIDGLHSNDKNEVNVPCTGANLAVNFANNDGIDKVSLIEDTPDAMAFETPINLISESNQSSIAANISDVSVDLFVTNPLNENENHEILNNISENTNDGEQSSIDIALAEKIELENTLASAEFAVSDNTPPATPTPDAKPQQTAKTEAPLNTPLSPLVAQIALNSPTLSASLLKPPVSDETSSSTTGTLETVHLTTSSFVDVSFDSFNNTNIGAFEEDLDEFDEQDISLAQFSSSSAITAATASSTATTNTILFTAAPVSIASVNILQEPVAVTADSSNDLYGFDDDDDDDDDDGDIGTVTSSVGRKIVLEPTFASSKLSTNVLGDEDDEVEVVENEIELKNINPEDEEMDISVSVLAPPVSVVEDDRVPELSTDEAIGSDEIEEDYQQYESVKAPQAITSKRTDTSDFDNERMLLMSQAMDLIDSVSELIARNEKLKMEHAQLNEQNRMLKEYIANMMSKVCAEDPLISIAEGDFKNLFNKRPD
ncbi:hypothetical protein HK100_002065 [Physocladia obscura]|uniref:Uncharacterized protein n=1 Tax=Physocladia obscura TaxID=109957 RepID=A0AAD5XFP0_9FUNG|nr:hypothetical protein HK100_002065 [Physocladia obscura]